MNFFDIVVVENVFTPLDCDRIVAMHANEPYEDGKIQENRKDFATRSSRIQFVDVTDDNRWVFDKLVAIAKNCNERVFGFELSGMEEGFQFARYDVSDHYRWHVDLGANERMRRKLSISVLLNDDYEGGTLEFFPSGFAPPVRKGVVAVFPSFMVHRVAPVTKGTRYSLVSWVAGDSPFA